MTKTMADLTSEQSIKDEKFERELSELKASKSVLEAANSELEAAKAELESRVAQLEKDVASKAKEVELRDQNISEVERELDQKRDKIIELT